MKNLTVILSALLLLTISHVALADVETWLARISEAYGGQQQINAAQSYRQYGVTFSSLRGREGKLLRAYRHPDRLLIEIDYGQGELESRLLSGARSWKQNEQIQEPFYSAMLLQAARIGLPAALLAFRQHVRDVGSYQGLQGNTLHGLALRFHRRNQLMVGIDLQSGRIVESRGVIKTGQFNMDFTTLYDDFRMVDGRLFAFKESHYVMGRKTGYTHLERIIIEPLDDDMFYPRKLPSMKPNIIVRND